MAMRRLTRVALARGLPVRRAVALKPPTSIYTSRNFSVSSKTLFQTSHILHNKKDSSSDPKEEQNLPPPSGAAGRILVAEPGSKVGFRTVLLLLAAISGFTAWWFYPRHPYTPEVAAHLRKALKAESENFGGQDLQEAVKYYIEALMEADAQGLSPLSNDYTGIQLKLAEMYEELDYPNAANDVYMEICTTYGDAMKKNKIDPANRPEIVLKSLRVGLKMAHNIAFNGGKGTETQEKIQQVLKSQVSEAQQEVAKRLPQAAVLLKLANEDPEKPNEQDFITQLKQASAEAQKLKSAGDFKPWEPFRDELIAARDLITTNAFADDPLPDAAIRQKQITYQIMLASGCSTAELLDAQFNLSSMFYLMHEKLEGAIKQVEKKKGDVVQSRTHGVLSLDHLQAGRVKTLARSEFGYKKILELISGLKPGERSDKDIEQVQARCTYSMGVIAMKKGDLAKAQDLLLKAQNEAQNYELVDVAAAAADQLAKVDELAKDPSKQIDTDNAISLDVPKFKVPPVDAVDEKKE